jgi:CubicO group peptidase (beta-lactamase class C family)
MTLPDEEITRLLQEYLRTTSTQGAALAVLKDGRVLFSMAGGVASRKDNSPMTTSTLFGAGSINKTFTALAFLLLEREGLLSLQDPVSKYLPEVEREVQYVHESPMGEHAPLLLKHLLSHTSGIPELGYIVSLFFRLCGVEGQGPYTPDDTAGLFSGVIKAARVRYRQPGAKFLYSNENYVLLARIAELVTGESFAEVVCKRILLPLGMNHSSIGFHGDNQSLSRITGYVPAASGPAPVALTIPEASHGPGGLVTTIEDMSRYLAFLQGQGQLGGQGITVYAPSLWTKVVPRDGVAGLHYGLGWYIQEDEFSEPLIYHGGDILFSGGICALLPQQGVGIVVGQNAAGSPSLTAFARKVLRHFLHGEEQTGNDIATKTLTPDEITGVYQSHDRVYSMEACFDHGILKLRLRIPGSSATPELPFAISDVTEWKSEFRPADYPPSPRRGGCVFIRSGAEGQVWLQYENYLLQKTAAY